VKRRFRLTRSNDIKRVRRLGKSYAHPLVVLVVMITPGISQRISVITGKSVGGAVQRNRVRRRLRTICDQLLPVLNPGFEAVLIARVTSNQAEFTNLEQAVAGVFRRAGLINNSHE
jgi:ribonuclease P protein component